MNAGAPYYFLPTHFSNFGGYSQVAAIWRKFRWGTFRASDPILKIEIGDRTYLNGNRGGKLIPGSMADGVGFTARQLIMSTASFHTEE